MMFIQFLNKKIFLINISGRFCWIVFKSKTFYFSNKIFHVCIEFYDHLWESFYWSSVRWISIGHFSQHNWQHVTLTYEFHFVILTNNRLDHHVIFSSFRHYRQKFKWILPRNLEFVVTALKPNEKCYEKMVDRELDARF